MTSPKFVSEDRAISPGTPLLSGGECRYSTGGLSRGCINHALAPIIGSFVDSNRSTARCVDRVSKLYGVSDVGVRKLARRYGLLEEYYAVWRAT